MNTNQIKFDPDWKAAMRSVGKKRIETVFDEIKRVKLEEMEYCPKEELTEKQAGVKLLSELRDLFLQSAQKSSANPESVDED